MLFRSEQNTIRAEQTDASLNPAAVQVMAQLAQVLQSLGYSSAEQAQQALGGGPQGEEVPAEAGPGMNDMRTLLGAAAGQPGSGEQPIPAAEAAPGNTVEGQANGAGPMAEGSQVLAQTMVKGGEAQNRLMFQQQVGQPPTAEGA